MWPNRENCKDFERSNRISNSISNRSQGIVLHRRLQAIQQHLPKGLDFIVVYVFRWPCYQIQADTPVDVWSNHACQVALFFPSINTACSSRSVRSCPASELLAQVGGSVNTRSSPASGNAPLGNQREPTGRVLSKVGQSSVCLGGLAVTGLGKECTLTPSIRSESERELLDLHFHRRPRPEFQDTAEG